MSFKDFVEVDLIEEPVNDNVTTDEKDYRKNIGLSNHNNFIYDHLLNFKQQRNSILVLVAMRVMIAAISLIIFPNPIWSS